MNILSDNNMKLVALIVLIISIKLFLDHRRASYTGVYDAAGYSDISNIKHDLTKTFWVELFVLLSIGLANGEKLYDPDNFTGSWIGKTMIIVFGYFTYYELVQPYIVKKLPAF